MKPFGKEKFRLSRANSNLDPSARSCNLYNCLVKVDRRAEREAVNEEAGTVARDRDITAFGNFSGVQYILLQMQESMQNLGGHARKVKGDSREDDLG